MLQFKSNIPLKFEQIQKLERRSRDVQRADVRSKDVVYKSCIVLTKEFCYIYF